MKTMEDKMKPYELWYEFLKRTDPSTWSEEVKRDFGGVLTTDFFDWFFEVRPELFWPHGPVSDDKWRRNAPFISLWKGENIEDINRDTHSILVIDRSQPHSVLEEKFKQHLQIYARGPRDVSGDSDVTGPKQRKRGASTWEESNALYPFKKRPNIAALEQVLYVHDLQRDHPTWKHWKIGVKAKEKFKDLLPLMKLKEGEVPSMEHKEILNAKVGYFLARAKKIKAGVIEGVFPAV